MKMNNFQLTNLKEFDMKKIFAFALVITLAALALSLAACGGRNNSASTPSASPGGGSGAQSAGTVSGADMEKKVAAYLSAIGGPSSISLCGGGKIEFEPQNEWVSMWGDSWTIKDPKMSYEDLVESVNAQLTAAGFIKDYSMLGFKWVKKAGAQGIGVMLDKDGSAIAVRMTYFAKDYSMDFIKSQETVMPKIIPGISAEKALPENFSITWKTDYGYKRTLIRKDGDWLYCADSREENDADQYSSAYYSVALAQGGGSYKFYQYSASMSGSTTKPRESQNFTTTASDFQTTLNNIFDCEYGYGMDLSISTWLQMSKDFADGTNGKGNMRHKIPENMVITKTETIAGVTCDVAASESWGPTYEYAYDPQTGVLFRYSKTESGNTTDYLLVTEYSANPSALGNFPGVN
jgi:hypothetical protein